MFVNISMNDVTLNYIIKDYNGKVYFTKSETLLVEEQVNLKRSFNTKMLPIGKYVIGVELVYPSGVAPSSTHIRVVKKEKVSLFSPLKKYPQRFGL